MAPRGSPRARSSSSVGSTQSRYRPDGRARRALAIESKRTATAVGGKRGGFHRTLRRPIPGDVAALSPLSSVRRSCSSTITTACWCVAVGGERTRRAPAPRVKLSRGGELAALALLERSSGLRRAVSSSARVAVVRAADIPARAARAERASGSGPSGFADGRGTGPSRLNRANRAASDGRAVDADLIVLEESALGTPQRSRRCVVALRLTPLSRPLVSASEVEESLVGEMPLGRSALRNFLRQLTATRVVSIRCRSA